MYSTDLTTCLASYTLVVTVQATDYVHVHRPWLVRTSMECPEQYTLLCSVMHLRVLQAASSPHLIGRTVARTY